MASCQELNAAIVNLLEAFHAPCTDVRAAWEAFRHAGQVVKLTQAWNGEGSPSELEALRRPGQPSFLCVATAWRGRR